MHGMRGGRRYLDINIFAFPALLLLLSSFFRKLVLKLDIQRIIHSLAVHIHSLAVLE